MFRSLLRLPTNQVCNSESFILNINGLCVISNLLSEVCVLAKFRDVDRSIREGTAMTLEKIQSGL